MLGRTDGRQGATPFHRVQASVWGFARTRAEALEQLLMRQIVAHGPTDCTVERPDPDTLTVTTPWLDFSRTCLPSGLSSLLADPEFAGLPMMLRFTIAEYHEKPGVYPVASRTLVLCGQWDAGTLIVKAAWPAGTFGTGDRIYKGAPWPLEARFFEDLDSYRNTGELSSGWETEFVSQAKAWISDRLARSVMIVPGQPKLRVFLSQAFLFLAMLATGLLLLPFVPLHEVMLLLGIVLTGAGAWGLIYIIRERIQVIAKRHAMMQRAFRELHAKPLKFVPVNLVELGVLDEPITRKYCTELEALRCQHCADLATELREEGIRVQRHYALPTERTFVTLSIMLTTRTLKLYPAKAMLSASTYFADGHRLTCGNTDMGRRKRIVPNVAVCRWQNTPDPESFLNRVRERIQQMLAEGRQLARPMALDDHLKRLQEDFALLSEYRRRTGYFSWLDAVRQEFRRRDREE